MKHYVLSYLKRNNITDPFVVNRLFVTIFMRWFNKYPRKNTWLQSYLIDSNDCEYVHIETLMDKISSLTINIEDLIQLFEYVISPSDRIITGAVYTPQYIRECILRTSIDGYSSEQLADLKFADISCGCGGFLMDVAYLLHEKTGKSYKQIFQDNIFGVDIQEYSIERTKLLLTLIALFEGEDDDMQFNLWQADSLEFDFKEIGPLDVIIGNPPYVSAKHISDSSKMLMRKWSVCGVGNLDLYIPFFQIAIEALREGGRLGYITMNSFLTSLNGRALRHYFADNKFDINIVDFRGYQIFKRRSTYTCLFFLNKCVSDCVKYCINDGQTMPASFQYEHIPYNKLDNHKGWFLNDRKSISKMESIGVPLGEFCHTRHGIATLSNSTYIFVPHCEDDGYYILIKDNKEYKIEKEICRDVVNSNKLNTSINFSEAKEKVIYPYFINKLGKISIIPEEIMQEKYPYVYQYLTDCKHILSTRDKGQTSAYPTWYAYGRTQSLIMPKYKLFLPKIANKPLQCSISDDENILLYNGMAYVSNDITKIKIVKSLLESKIFWDYIVKNSKPYNSGYYSLNGVNMKYFGVPELSDTQIDTLLSFTNKTDIDAWLSQFYR